ncbi:MAG: tRNA (adenosine(37)-N6)-threonylcarbamoyltransferase complex dimerization subunit type 1 TsaB [Firmicutes bacterium]|nr:tRNA (adenosine(37)-N6)-threonylcarbamoyltransferase complex dimerization subunit type 1 TsaB [Bacillota bacterium]
MILLSLDTSGPVASAAVLDGEKAVAEASAAGTKKHAEILMPMIEKLLDLSGFSSHNLDLVACTSGPGSFTGLRIGAACALGLAYALGIPVAQVPTLDATAYNAVIPEPKPGTGMAYASGAPRDRLSGRILVPMMDARRAQVYAAFYESEDGGMRKLTPDMAVSLREVLAEAAKYGREILFTGDGAALHKDALTASGLDCRVAPSYGRGIAFSAGLIGLKMAAEKKLVSIAEFGLAYLRKPQAERERAERLAREAQETGLPRRSPGFETKEAGGSPA